MYSLSRFFGIKPPPKPDYDHIYTSPNYHVETLGECNQGNYVKIYIPDNPYIGDSGNPQAVIYLHGFALGASEIYSTHLEHLVKQGYYVIYPNYQRGFCAFSHCLAVTVLQLAEEILSPFPISPQTWINSAINSAIKAYQYINLFEKDVDTYLFGHSLGGLFALSWPNYAQHQVPANMLPKQIIVADPVPDSESNIPAVIRDLTECLGGFKDKVAIETTGVDIKVPIAILHGNEDTVIPKCDWLQPFYHSIATLHKTMYLSFSDQHGWEPLNANHEQATVNTSFVPDCVAQRLLDGVGAENDLNWRYIWYALDQVIRCAKRADELIFDLGNWSDGQPVKAIEVYLPAPKF
ncbi:hypothetical protein NIES4074_28760 [Cylindrospermum sp. NIES-4074]|nr:hypothetical protein NIES4074_28760 [Cylindrospermum sp. NIES-4074]